MGTTLTGTKPKDTYDSLIKVGDNGPIGATAKTLSDGLGNDLPISVSTSNVGIGTSAPNTKLDVNGTINVRTNGFEFGRITTNNVSSGNGGLTFQYVTGGVFTNGILLDAGGVVSLTQGQIKFPATQVASADPNTLDDYEEGTWTMGISFGGASVGVTYASNTGTYTKIGRKVTVNGYLGLSNKGSSTGIVRVTGLPFTIGNSSNNYSAPSFYIDGNITFVGQIQGFGDFGGTTIILGQATELGVTSLLTDVNFANNSALIVSFTYFV